MTEERLQEIERKLSRDVVMRCNGETGIWTSEGAEPVSHEDIRALIAEVRRLWGNEGVSTPITVTGLKNGQSVPITTRIKDGKMVFTLPLPRDYPQPEGSEPNRDCAKFLR